MHHVGLRLAGLITLALFGTFGGIVGAAHAMLPGEPMHMEEMPMSDVADPQTLVCIELRDPEYGIARRVTSTVSAAQELGGSILSQGACEEADGATASETNYGITHLPETLLRGGIPQSPLQTVFQFILTAIYIVLGADDGSHRIHT